MSAPTAGAVRRASAPATGAARRASRFFIRMPLTLGVALIYLLARVLTTGMFAVAAQLSDQASRFGENATIGDFVLGWDAQWYWYIADYGYPTELPLNTAGQVKQNSWAFLPFYPELANAIGLPFGSWAVGALIVSLVAGYLCCLVLYRILAPRIGRVAGLWAVAFMAAGPLGALFQIGYAEALAMLFLLLALDAVMRRRYVLLYFLIPLMGFTRPGVLAFALMLGCVLVMRWLRRREDPLRGKEIAHFIALGALGSIVGFSWQIIAGAVTGDHSAYLDTELAWRRDWTRGQASGFLPFDGWINGAAIWFRIWGMPPWLGYVALGVLVLLTAALLLFSKRVRRLGPEIRFWSASYLLYLLAVFFPQSSTLRLLFPLTPLCGALAVQRSRLFRWLALLIGLGLQWLWIYNMYAMGNTFWQVP